MRWQGGRRSSNIEDRPGSGVGRPLAIGGGVTPLVVALLVLLLGGDPSVLLSGDPQAPAGGPGCSSRSACATFRKGLEQGTVEACDTFRRAE
ncbi:neutral zinc metallopeptidase [Archangium violaceum]|uniref:Uncharacterized protein n=1 Tax=Archangium violaceum Cb vi76 TaxID=1406225 RepID=A0A084SLG2_9BACT|nr:neutral zinc metallopeptidase [Archangium violaceum]KFA89297.1 hypothetical protein Q664_35735 [Archangium violaceum Cb vi76]